MTNLLSLERKKMFNKILSTARKPRILLDQDDVLAMCLPEVIERYNQEYKTNFTINHITNWDMTPILGKEVYKYFTQKGFFENLKPVEGAIEILERLWRSDKYDFFIVTSAHPSFHVEKLNWIKKYLPFIPEDQVIFAKRKDTVWGDILLDDGAHNIEAFKEIGLPVVFDMPHNRHITDVPRVHNWKEFEELLNGIFGIE